MPIRPATVADIAPMVRLERESATAGHWTTEQYRQAVEREGPERLVLVAERTIHFEADRERSQNSALDCVGFLVARQLGADWELENLVVTPTARRRGFGERLLHALFAAAGASTAVFLEVRESNAVARGLYERSGFLETGRRKSYYTDPVEDAILYRRMVD